VDILVLLGMVLNLAVLCWLIWAMATRRIGLTHWTPGRQQRRYGGLSPQARAAAEKVKRLSG
jgi:hypothetical protein